MGLVSEIIVAGPWGSQANTCTNRSTAQRDSDQPAAITRPWGAVALAVLTAALLLVHYILCHRRGRNLPRLGSTLGPTPQVTDGDAPVVEAPLLSYLKRNVFRAGRSFAAADRTQCSGEKKTTTKKKARVGQLDALTAMMNRTGWDTFQYSFLGTRTLMTRDPVNLRAILSTQFREFGMGSRKGNLRAGVGRGIFAADGDEWHRSRAMFRPYFMREDTRHPNLEPHVRRLIDGLTSPRIDEDDEDDKDGWTRPADLQPLFYRLGLDMSADIFFGLGPEDGDGCRPAASEQELAAFAHDFDKVQESLGVRCRLSWAYWLCDGVRFRLAARRVRAFARLMVRRAEEKRMPAGAGAAAAVAASPGRSTFIDALAEAVADPDLVHSQLLHTLIASRDTIAGTLAWLFLHLSRRPDLYASLRAAIVASFGGYDDDGGGLSPAALASCMPLQNVILETLRLHPAIPINTRTALVDTTLPRGGGRGGALPVRLRAGEEVTYSVYALHRDPAVWGADATEFRPARWDERRLRCAGRPLLGWEFLAFSAGPRVCVGQRLAMHELGYAIVRLLQRFDALVGPSGGADDGDEGGAMEARVTLTNSPARGLVVRLREAGRRTTVADSSAG